MLLLLQLLRLLCLRAQRKEFRKLPRKVLLLQRALASRKKTQKLPKQNHRVEKGVRHVPRGEGTESENGISMNFNVV